MTHSMRGDEKVGGTCFNTSGEYAGVHEGGHTEVGEHKKEDHAIVQRYGHGELLRKPGTSGGRERRGSGGLTRRPVRDGTALPGCSEAGWGGGASCKVTTQTLQGEAFK